jgi:hypothetical protein
MCWDRSFLTDSSNCRDRRLEHELCDWFVPAQTAGYVFSAPNGRPAGQFSYLKISGSSINKGQEAEVRLPLGPCPSNRASDISAEGECGRLPRWVGSRTSMYGQSMPPHRQVPVVSNCRVLALFCTLPARSGRCAGLIKQKKGRRSLDDVPLRQRAADLLIHSPQDSYLRQLFPGLEELITRVTSQSRSGSSAIGNCLC